MTTNAGVYSSQPTRVEHVSAGAKRFPLYPTPVSSSYPPQLSGLWARQPIKGIFLALKALRVTIIDLCGSHLICFNGLMLIRPMLLVRPVCAVYYAFYRPRPTWSWKDSMGCYTINQLMQAGKSRSQFA